MNMEEFKTILERGTAEIEEKKSRFIADIFYTENSKQAEEKIKEVKKKYFDAKHHCYAYRVIENNAIKEKQSDDGEPSGTAGKPMLDVLLGEELYNTAVVVTRYFGGTLLGTGGLVRAYSKAVQEGLAQSDLIEKQYGNILEIGTDYNGVGKIQYLIGENKIPVLESEYTDKVRFQVLLPMSETEHFQKLLTEATNARASQEIVDSCYYAVWNGKILMGAELRG